MDRFQKVKDLWKELGIDKLYHAHRQTYIRKTHPAIFNDIMVSTAEIPNASFTERAFCFVNNVTSRPVCKMCSRTVRFGRQADTSSEYNRYCSANCARSDFITLLGVENPSQLLAVKKKKRKLALRKYGVDNVSKAAEVKELLSEQRSEYWKTIHAGKDFTIGGLTRLRYSHRCHQYAETQYFRNLALLDPECKRGKDWHVDHIFSVSDGFDNDVPINIISDISNLRLISAAENLQKHKSSYKTLTELYEDYGRNQTR